MAALDRKHYNELIRDLKELYNQNKELNAEELEPFMEGFLYWLDQFIHGLKVEDAPLPDRIHDVVDISAGILGRQGGYPSPRACKDLVHDLLAAIVPDHEDSNLFARLERLNREQGLKGGSLGGKSASFENVLSPVPRFRRGPLVRLGI